MLLGESGTGKSASMRNFDPETIGVINVAGKPLPFRSTSFKTLKTDNYAQITKALKTSASKTIIIDDAQYLLANEFMRTVNEKGYDKFNQLASNYWNLVQTVIHGLPDDKIVYFMQHIARDDMGREKAKTIGRMLDEKITVEGMFTIVLKTVVRDGEYFFSTRNSGADTVKTPLGMFDSELISNDLAEVDKAIREYYDLPALGAKE